MVSQYTPPSSTAEQGGERIVNWLLRHQKTLSYAILALIVATAVFVTIGKRKSASELQNLEVAESLAAELTKRPVLFENREDNAEPISQSSNQEEILLKLKALDDASITL